jgi:beta-phosphoglucomutase family hydrolase
MEQHPNLLDGSYAACLFDMDGVLTDTATTHAKAWQHTFDDFLAEQTPAAGIDLSPFDRVEEYLAYVDGKPRNDGVRDFLRSRGITLPEGNIGDPPSARTVWGVADRKNEQIERYLEEEGVQVYDDAVILVKQLHAAGIAVGVVSSSTNTDKILTIAGILHYFDADVNGRTIIEQHLAGKPAPDTFLEAAAQLGVAPAAAVVLEDALSGVTAGKHGQFGLVVGVDRTTDGARIDSLLQNGADVATTDLTSLLPPDRQAHVVDATVAATPTTRRGGTIHLPTEQAR